MDTAIAAARTAEELQAARELFSEYAAALNFALCFQDFERELATLPGDYAPPSGALLLAHHADRYAGCVALRSISRQICEMKRLYVRPAFRGQGIGRLLAQHAVDLARAHAYRWIYLDTVPSMQTAIALYRSMGFTAIAPYRPNPIAGALYLARDLSA